VFSNPAALLLLASAVLIVLDREVFDHAGVAFEQGRPSAAAAAGAVRALTADEAFEVAVFNLDGGLGGAVGVEADLDLAGMVGVGTASRR
jgi:hypothetical protein